MPLAIFVIEVRLAGSYLKQSLKSRSVTYPYLLLADQPDVSQSSYLYGLHCIEGRILANDEEQVKAMEIDRAAN